MKIADKDFYSVKEISEMAGITTVAVFQDIQKGRLLPEKEKLGGSYVISKYALALYLRYRAEVRQKRKENLLKRQAKIAKQLQNYNRAE